MAYIKDDIRTYLLTKSALTALISQRIYSLPAPQGVTYPFVSIHRIGGDREQHLLHDAAFGKVRLQIDARAETSAAAEAVAEQIRIALDAYAGTAGSSTVHSVQLIDERDFVEPTDDGREIGVYVVSSDYEIAFDYTQAN